MMTYKEDKRTKNLSLRDIHVGDWVQAWDHITKRYSPPERITSIHDDGTIHTKVDPEQGDPYEYDISEIDALPITPELLLGFGFDEDENEGIYLYEGENFIITAMSDTSSEMDFWFTESIEHWSEYLGVISYMHDLQQALYSYPNFIGTFNPKWKGV